MFWLFCSINYTEMSLSKGTGNLKRLPKKQTKPPNKLKTTTKPPPTEKPTKQKTQTKPQKRKRTGQGGSRRENTFPQGFSWTQRWGKTLLSQRSVSTHQISSILDHVQPFHTLLVSQQMNLAIPERRATRAHKAEPYSEKFKPFYPVLFLIFLVTIFSLLLLSGVSAGPPA